MAHARSDLVDVCGVFLELPLHLLRANLGVENGGIVVPIILLLPRPCPCSCPCSTAGTTSTTSSSTSGDRGCCICLVLVEQAVLLLREILQLAAQVGDA